MKNKRTKYTQINTSKSKLCTVKCTQCDKTQSMAPTSTPSAEREKSDRSQLGEASSTNHVDVVEWLVQNGADVQLHCGCRLLYDARDLVQGGGRVLDANIRARRA